MAAFSLPRLFFRSLPAVTISAESAMLVLLLMQLRTAAALVFLNTGSYEPPRGDPIPLWWADAVKPVTITLCTDDGKDLEKVIVVVSNYDGRPNNKFSWTPPPIDFPADHYEFQIVEGTKTDYTPSFTIPPLPPAPPSSKAATLSSKHLVKLSHPRENDALLTTNVPRLT